MPLYRLIEYEDLKEGDLIQFFGVHVLKWERLMGPNIRPDYAFVEVSDYIPDSNADAKEGEQDGTITEIPSDDTSD